MIKTKYFAALAVLLFSGIASARVCAYQDKNFGGAVVCWEAGQRGSANLSNIGFNDTISSIQITRGEEVEVCTDAGYRGSCTVITSDVYNMGRGWNDQISSIAITEARRGPPGRGPGRPGPGPGPGPRPPGPGRPQPQPPRIEEACFYTDAGYNGAGFCVRAGSTVANLGNTGYNDKVSSIRIPRGLTVTIYQDANFAGDRRTYQGDVLNLQGDFNDKTSSIVVERGW